MIPVDTRLLGYTGVTTPIICGAMYPCSNPELMAAASEAGGIGIVQPISMTYVHGYDFREGLQFIKQLTDKPIGMNALIEQSTKPGAIAGWLLKGNKITHLMRAFYVLRSIAQLKNSLLDKTGTRDF